MADPYYDALNDLEEPDDQADSALLDPGSDGLVTAQGAGLVRELARRRDHGASLDELRRDAGQIDRFRVTDRVLEAAVEQGRRLNDYDTLGTIRERPRRFHGIAIVACAGCGRRVLARALRAGGCVVCQG